MTACEEMDGLLALRAGGDLAPEDGARLDEHLIRCDRCRAELTAYEDALDLARLPAADRPGTLAVATLSAYRRSRRRRVTGLTLGAGIAAAALAAGVVLTPALLTLRSLPAQHRPAAQATADDRSAAAPGATASGEDGTVTVEEAALAALDEADTP